MRPSRISLTGRFLDSLGLDFVAVAMRCFSFRELRNELRLRTSEAPQSACPAACVRRRSRLDRAPNCLATEPLDANSSLGEVGGIAVLGCRWKPATLQPTKQRLSQ